MKNENADVILTYRSELLDSQFVEQWTTETESSGLKVRLQSQGMTAFSSLDWAIPTAIIAYVSKPYFEAFLSEAGKDSYVALKRALMILIEKVFGKQSSNRPSVRFSFLISIYSETATGKSVKFTIPEGLKLEEYERLIEELHDLMGAEHSSSAESSWAKILEDTVPPARTYYFEYLPSDKCWKYIDMLEEVKKLHEKQSKEE